MNKKDEKGCKITVKGKEALDALYQKTGVIRVEILGRAMEWLADQDKSLQAIILGQVAAEDEIAILEAIKARIQTKLAVELAQADAGGQARKPKKRAQSKGA